MFSGSDCTNITVLKLNHLPAAKSTQISLCRIPVAAEQMKTSRNVRTNETKVAPAHTKLFYLSLLQFHPAVKKELKNHGSLDQLQGKENEWTLPHLIMTICRGNCAEIGIYQIPPAGQDPAAPIH